MLYIDSISDSTIANKLQQAYTSSAYSKHWFIHGLFQIATMSIHIGGLLSLNITVIQILEMSQEAALHAVMI